MLKKIGRLLLHMFQMIPRTFLIFLLKKKIQKKNDIFFCVLIFPKIKILLTKITGKFYRKKNNRKIL